MNVKMFLRSRLGNDLIVSFIFRVLAALGAVVLGVVLGRVYGAEGVGLFAIFQSIVSGGGILARYGLNNALIKYVSPDIHSKNTILFLSRALLVSFTLSIVISAIVLLSRHYISVVFNISTEEDLVLMAALAIPAVTCAFVLSGFMKAIRKPASANMLENGAVSLIAAILILFSSQYGVLDARSAYVSFTVAAWLVMAAGGGQVLLWIFRFRKELTCSHKRISFSEFGAIANTFFIMSLSRFMQQVVSVWVVGYCLSNNELGLFKTAERVTLVINITLMVINTVFPPRFATLYFNNEIKSLEKLAQSGAKIGFYIASPLLVVCLIYPEQILSIFGEEFREAANILRIIAIGQTIVVVTGSVEFLLSMTGNEKIMRNISIVCSCGGVFMMWILASLLGPLGAGVGLALLLSAQNIIAVIMVWKKLDIWALPFWTPKLGGRLR